MFVWLRIKNVTKTITSSKKYWTISDFFHQLIILIFLLQVMEEDYYSIIRIIML